VQAIEPTDQEAGRDQSTKGKGAEAEAPNVRFSFSIPHEFLPIVPAPVLDLEPVVPAVPADGGVPGVGAPTPLGVSTA